MGFSAESIRGYVIEMLYLLPAIIFALSIHEFSHAYVSSRLGDPLPKVQGRLTLNPFRHIDPLGFLMLMIARFGWAKPVMVDPRFYKNKKLGMSLTALAGPASNLLAAFLLTPVWMFSVLKLGSSTALAQAVTGILSAGIIINIGLGIFNLIPISPLDGSKVLASVLPLKYYNYLLKYERYGFIVLIILLLDIPVRALTYLGIPYGIAQYFGLGIYLETLRGLIIELYSGIFINIFSIFM